MRTLIPGLAPSLLGLALLFLLVYLPLWDFTTARFAPLTPERHRAWRTAFIAALICGLAALPLLTIAFLVRHTLPSALRGRPIRGAP